LSVSSGLPLARYVVGLDLGTTNCALSYVDTAEIPWKTRTFKVLQHTSANQLEALETLPSAVYLLTGPSKDRGNEFGDTLAPLPWTGAQEIVGQFARDHGLTNPERLVASAKSWLCHPDVDRLAAILPWQSSSDAKRISPVEASSRYLAHYRAAWDAAFPDEPLARQDFVLTLPASFDETARELTIRAAQMGGLARVWLIEEPQAAFYAWLAKHAETWQTLVTAGENVLVVDVGGGTADFTLIRAGQTATGLVQFQRVAVGQHLILGGDNIDLALAQQLEAKLSPGGPLEAGRFSQLLRRARVAKETLLGPDAPAEIKLSLPAVGSRLLAGSLQVTVTKGEVEQLATSGFFPVVEYDAEMASEASGFQEFGLPYATDTAITRYLAQFCRAHFSGDHPSIGADSKPDHVLFNGGVFAAELLRQQVIACLAKWFGGGTDWQPNLLENDRLDLAVSLGAAYYGMVRRGEGVRISAGLARTYYLGVIGDEGLEGVVVVPAGTEPGEECEPNDQEYQLTTGRPVEFPLYYSSTRLTDVVGERIPISPEAMQSLPPLRTVISGQNEEGGRMRVRLEAGLCEIGTLDVRVRQAASNKSWKLLFDVRGATRTDLVRVTTTGETAGVVEHEVIEKCAEVIGECFDTKQPATISPEKLMKQLGVVTGLDRAQWPPTLLREMWTALMTHASGRGRSAQHEARWLNLAGYALRPGLGIALDDWRVSETYKLLAGKLMFGQPANRVEQLVLWRRIAGGLASGQQLAIVEPLLMTIRQTLKLACSKKGVGSGLAIPMHEVAEQWRLVGAFEQLPESLKRELGGELARCVVKLGDGALRDAALWSVGRIGARQPALAPMNYALSTAVVEPWIELLLKEPMADKGVQLALGQLARKVNDRYRDISAAWREKVLEKLRLVASPEVVGLIEAGGRSDVLDGGAVLGDSLPIGLSLG
jgi:molecular chaperone DnaK (HSP70)